MWMTRALVVVLIVGFSMLLISLEESWKTRNAIKLSAAFLSLLFVAWEVIWWVITGRL
jgi:hypothetical protein